MSSHWTISPYPVQRRNVLLFLTVGSMDSCYTTSNDHGPSDHAVCFGRDLLPWPGSTVPTLVAS